MKNIKLNAVTFRLILSVLLFVTAALIVAVVWFSNAKLKEFSVQVSQAASDATASQDSLQTLQKMKQELDSQKEIINKAASIVADSKGYKYQDQIIKDLNEYASASGLTITNFSFAAAADTTPKAATPAAGGATATPAPAAPSGVKSTSASITLKAPVNYVNLLQFIHAIEQNLTKMQISRISLSKGATKDEVITESLEIQVYIN